MDAILVPFCRQYLQQVIPTNIRYPPPKHLVVPYVQDQIGRYFFDDSRNAHLPPAHYQRIVLKRIIVDIERELASGSYDPDEYAVSDVLMTRMGSLAILPRVSDTEAAQLPRTLSYFLPTNTLAPNGSNKPDNERQLITRQILIHESPNLLAAGSNVGLRTWEACLYLGYYLCTYPEIVSKHSEGMSIANSNIIELGAGTGLLSLICSLNLGARHVMVTDGLPHVVEGIKTNLVANNTAGILKPHQSITSAVLDWTNHDDIGKILDINMNFNYILGADVTYHPELHDSLASLIRLLLDKSPKARVLISETVRNPTTRKHFRQICEKDYGLSIRYITGEEWKCPDFKDQTGLFHEQAFPNILMDITLSRLEQ